MITGKIIITDRERDELLVLLAPYITGGPLADFGDKLKAVNLMTDEERAVFIEAARQGLSQDGELEIDDDARVSESAEGAYVEAWVWVGRGEIDPNYDPNDYDCDGTDTCECVEHQRERGERG
jgi:hypothetical protein